MELRKSKTLSKKSISSVLLTAGGPSLTQHWDNIDPSHPAVWMPPPGSRADIDAGR